MQNTAQGYRLVALALLSLALMFADSRFDYLTQVRYYAAMVVTPIQFLADLPSRASAAILSGARSRAELQRENEQLRETLLMQQYQLQKLDHLMAENQRLNDLLKSSAIVDDVVVRTQLIGESPDPYVKRILINKGSRDGVFMGQPVLDASGLMGQVVEVDLLSSWVLLITDPQHSTPVQINRNGVRKIATGTRDGLHNLTLENVAGTEDVEVGDVLVTSGLGGRFPPGYPVGVISDISFDPGKPFADVLVTPTAEISRSRNLLLVFENDEPRPPPATILELPVQQETDDAVADVLDEPPPPQADPETTPAQADAEPTEQADGQ